VDKITTVIFDLGRVLVGIDSGGKKLGGLLRPVAAFFSGNVFDAVYFLPEVRQHMTGAIDSREFHRRSVERFGLSLGYDEFCEAWCDMFHPVPAMRALFDEVSSRYRVGILSDTDPLHWSALLGLMPWLGAVDKPTLSHEVGFLKPHPALFSAAASDCGAAKEECLFIDDREENVIGARYYGMQALRFTGENKLRRDLAGLRIL
jgi:FMN phosphatase YigB (HAD superfamily)